MLTTLNCINFCAPPYVPLGCETQIQSIALPAAADTAVPSNVRSENQTKSIVVYLFRMMVMDSLWANERVVEQLYLKHARL